MPSTTETAERPFAGGGVVLLVDDEAGLLRSASLTLRSAGIPTVLTESDSRRVLPLLAERDVGVIVLDLTMPHLPGTKLLEEIRRDHPHLPVIVMTGRNEVDIAVSCMKAGAFDYLVKPVESARFVSSVKRALEVTSLQEEVSSLREHLLSPAVANADVFSAILTECPKMLSIFKYVEAIAPSGQPVLITGETGVGKELFSRAVHELSGRKGSFVAVNVAGLDDTVFSDTLFGHKRGAYTGAEHAREGLVAQASGGTLFLDEIGDMKETSQVKLLRLIEEKEYYPLGSDAPARSEARVVCATHYNVKELVSQGRFRRDLYYRLSTHLVHIPALRERAGDLVLLVDHFLEDAANSLQKKKPTVPPELYTLLSTYHFPGNLRELKTMSFDAVAQHRSGILPLDSFRKAMGEHAPPADPVSAPAEDGKVPFLFSGGFPTLSEAEDYLVAEALRRAKNNQGIAANLLGLTRQALNKRLARGAKAGKPPS
ncbi:MAG TPA: sigma-54 dependent transcriptional regulator [Candidatus Deferrimicrobiaceae bacterium]|jgi:DNA-binding NtrC family response regulator